MKKNLIILSAAAVLIVAVLVWNANNKPQTRLTESEIGGQISSSGGGKPVETAPKPGQYAPPFELAALEGTTAQPTTYAAGGKRDKLLLVNFWAAWCGPCEEEAPDLKDIYAQHQDQLELYAVNATNYDKLREAKDFVKEQQLQFPVLTDAVGTVGDLYKVSAYPTSFLIDRNGVILQRVEGVISREEWEELIQQAL